MNEPTRDQILALLEREIDKTKSVISEYETSAGPIAPDDAIGRVSRMDAINNKTIVEAALRTAREKLAKLQHMKDNLDSPDFGQCARWYSKVCQ